MCQYLFSSSFEEIQVVFRDPFTCLSNTKQDVNNKDKNKFISVTDTSSKMFNRAYVYYIDVITYQGVLSSGIYYYEVSKLYLRR
jgi:hypothetical protein